MGRTYLLINLADLVLCSVLERHVCGLLLEREELVE